MKYYVKIAQYYASLQDFEVREEGRGMEGTKYTRKKGKEKKY